MHVIDYAISPMSRNVPGLIDECRYFSLFSAALKETGFQDSLLLDRDEDYVPINYNALGFGSSETTRMIIDTKYYSKNLQEHFGKFTVSSPNFYQIHTYVMNEDKGHTGKVDGMLLHDHTG